MKEIEVFGNDEDNSMLIKIDDVEVFLTGEEAALLDSLMARAYKRHNIKHSVSKRQPGEPLTEIEPLQAGQF